MFVPISSLLLLLCYFFDGGETKKCGMKVSSQKFSCVFNPLQKNLPVRPLRDLGNHRKRSIGFCLQFFNLCFRSYLFLYLFLLLGSFVAHRGRDWNKSGRNPMAGFHAVLCHLTCQLSCHLPSAICYAICHLQSAMPSASATCNLPCHLQSDMPFAICHVICHDISLPNIVLYRKIVDLTSPIVHWKTR